MAAAPQAVTTDDWTIPEWTLGDRLRKSRLKAGFEQDEMASLMGTTRPSISAWERDMARPRDLVAVAKKWADYTRTPVIWLLGVESPSTQKFTRRSLRRSHLSVVIPQ